MGLAPDKKGVSPADTAMVLAISNAMYSFTSGENTFKGILKVEHDEYVTIVKKTLKFILIPAFTQKVAHN